jgi:hypothetical protein
MLSKALALLPSSEDDDKQLAPRNHTKNLRLLLLNGLAKVKVMSMDYKAALQLCVASLALRACHGYFF